MLDKFTEIENGDIFDTLEEALLSSCPICGTPLDWVIEYKYNLSLDHNTLSAHSHSCGLRFYIDPKYHDSNNTPSYYMIRVEQYDS